MDPTTNPALRSWVHVPKDSHFPIQNLPYGVFLRPNGSRRTGVAIGEEILDLTALSAPFGFDPYLPLFDRADLEPFMRAGPPAWGHVRALVSRLLSADEPGLRDDVALRERVMLSQADARMVLPTRIGDYTDFYSSLEHAQNVGTMLRGPDKALMPNWRHLPVAYHGRSSSIVVSGTDIRRPSGQSKPESAESPLFGPTRSLDFELETAAFVGPGNALGEPIPVAEAEGRLLGMVLLNDWSARDIQAWEYQPLGPFLGKNFATSISPWIVPMAALEPFRCDGPAQQPEPLPYLRHQGKTTFDIQLEVYLQTAKMDAPVRICVSNFKHLYWSLAQQVAHHTVTGCPLLPGDVLASGTISGPTPDSYGSMLELTWRGSKPMTLPSREMRRFLEDGDRVTMTAWCQGNGYRVGFGEVTGVVIP